MKLKAKKRRAAPKARHAREMPLSAQTAQNDAVQQPLRAHTLQMQVNAIRHKKLDALRAAGVRSALQRVEQVLHETRASPHASVLATASKLKNELRTLAIE